MTGRRIGVIGAGVVGVACARALQRAGHSVVLFDPAPPGALCSSGNAGHIALDHVRPLARPDVLAGVPRMLTNRMGPLTLRWRGVPAMTPWLARFTAAARPARVRAGTGALASLLAQALADWQTELALSGLSAMLLQRGALNVIETPRRRPIRRRRGSVSWPAMAWLSRTSLRPRSWIASPAWPSSRWPGGLSCRPRTWSTRSPWSSPSPGASPQTAAPWSQPLSPASARMPAGWPRWSPRPASTRWDSAVLAAGLASPILARAAGLHLPMTAERGYHAMLPSGTLPVPLPTTFNERGFVVTPMAHGQRLAGTVEFGAGGQPPSWARASILAEHAARLFGRPVQPTDRWQGDRPTLPDYLPALGPAPSMPNLILAAGHQHLGLTLAATTARLVTALLTGQPPGADLRPFDPARFGRANAA